MVRVLVVDDSAFMRSAISDILKSDPEIEVIGTARDGIEAVEMTQAMSPDVVTMDYEMPRMNGIEAVREIMKLKPTPCVMVSSYTKEGAHITLRALEEGAVDFIPKGIEKRVTELFKIKDEIIRKVKSAARAKLRKTVKADTLETKEVKPKPPTGLMKAIVVGASTGGPQAISEIIPMLPKDLPAGILVVIHMPPIFTATLAERLAEKAKVEVKEAKKGDAIKPGLVLIAPGGIHTKVKPGGVVELSQDPRNSIYIPSINEAMKTAAIAFRSRTIGIIMTGMGNDGVEGLRTIKSAGGKTVVQDESTSVVSGMPRAAVEAKAADHVVGLHSIPEIIIRLL